MTEAQQNENQENAVSPTKKAGRFGLWITLACLVISFLAPYGITFNQAVKSYRAGIRTTDSISQITEQDARNKALRSALVSFMIALFILTLWRFDQLVFHRDQDLKGDRRITALLFCLGFFLWMAWSGIANMMIMANDDITDVPAQLPGLSPR
ncbi:MAG: hypothetical protein KC777_30170 [Cyanobacteria bacterium HKST-UBA02]|nr:hypothetical protein [Cyanobacteria bacterium HKST-UBA02]